LTFKQWLSTKQDIWEMTPFQILAETQIWVKARMQSRAKSNAHGWRVDQEAFKVTT
jgi:hypothetical protein